LKFLLSRGRDLDAFCQHPRQKRRSPLIEIYPKGVARPDFGITRADAANEEMRKLQGGWDLVERINAEGTVTKHDCGGPAAGGMRPFRLLFEGDTASTDGGCPDLADVLKGRCRLNPKRRPKTIDFVQLDASFPLREWKGRTTPAIYELEGDGLRLCILEACDLGRPAGFEPGKGNAIYTFSRELH
jgi:uncharacterized protein (TIGR03067 family)